MPRAKPKSAPGRPTKLTSALRKKFVRAVKFNYFETAAALCGIDPRTARRWMKRGSDELERIEAGEPRSKENAAYALFCAEVRAAEAKGESEMVRRLTAHGKEHPSAVMQYLERKYPKRWGNRVKIVQEIEAELDAVFAKLEKHLTPEEYARALAALDAPDS